MTTNPQTACADLSGRIALITGSSRNLGYGIAETLVRAGATVVVHGSSPDSAEGARRKLLSAYPQAGVHAVVCGLGKAAEIEQVFADLAKRALSPDILVNNGAHLGLTGDGFLEQTPEFFREVLEVNLFGYFLCSQLAARAMKAKGHGHIINISSLAGEKPIFGRSAYNVSKAAIEGLTRAMALELVPHGIQVNTIVPNYIWTPRWDDLRPEDVCRRKLNTPCGEPTHAEEIAELVLFLASNKTPSLVGARIVIDGGTGIQPVPRDVAV